MTGNYENQSVKDKRTQLGDFNFDSAETEAKTFGNREYRDM